MSDYIDLSGGAKAQLAGNLAHLVEAVAADLRDEIVLQMDPGPARTGREYRVPGTGTIDPETGKTKRGTGRTYTASAPGEPPAIRTGEYANAWQTTPAVIEDDRVSAAATNDRKTADGRYFIGEILEYGADRAVAPGGGGTIVGYAEGIAPRPHIRPAMEIVAQRWDGTIRSHGAGGAGGSA